MRHLTGLGVFTKRCAGFQFHPQDWLHDWLTRACISCFAFSGRYALKLLKPWPASQPRAAPAPRWAPVRRFGPLALELRLHGLPLRLPHWHALLLDDERP